MRESPLLEALGERVRALRQEPGLSLPEPDAEISLPELFAIHGKEYYRRLKLLPLNLFLETGPPVVLATGGGVVTSPEALRLLQEGTTTIWLRATPEEHWDRVVKQGDL